MKNMKVQEAIGTHLVTLRDTDSALTGLKLLVKEGLSGAPVVSSDFKLVGMVTEFDLLLAIDYVGEITPIARVMSKDVTAVEPDTDLEEARKLILEHHYRRLPVIEAGRVVGVLSRRDILRVRFGV
jgi:CBS domain-containing protein